MRKAKSLSDLPDADLLKRAVEGDAQAYGNLYERYLERIYRYVYFRVGNESDAEDLTEMVFLKVWEGLPRFDPSQAPFGAWLHMVARNLVVDHYRTQRAHEELPQDLPSSRVEPEQAAVRETERDQLRAGLSQLKPDHQEVLTLRFINQMSHRETAEVMGRSVGAVRVLQHRALAALRKVMGPPEGETR